MAAYVVPKPVDIPQVAILTKIDEACPEVKKHLRNVYRAKYIKNKMEEFSVNVGIPMNCIFPVKNYHEEINLNSDIDSLILSALTNIINFGDDCINMGKDSDSRVCPPDFSTERTPPYAK
ncbi:hypothetical protein PFLUV_G00217720 [Perca fluviatilis]|uniref:Interferon-induced protein 44-like n=1 Tax=Perca fluviatilis TaxID=8168 RepID=A0A6A5DT49_PERFL|nr:hypothetical protein PFLUV_G00217720 [Perca fluviatilis]